MGEIVRLLGWTWPRPALRRPWTAATVAIPPALLVRALIPGVLGASVSAATYLLAYLAVWRWMGLDADDRAVLTGVGQRARSLRE
jgi:hypothetical protein